MGTTQWQPTCHYNNILRQDCARKCLSSEMGLEAQVVGESHHALSSHGAILLPSVLWTHQYESYLHKIAERGRLHWKRFSGHSSQCPKDRCNCNCSASSCYYNFETVFLPCLAKLTVAMIGSSG